MKRQIAFTVYLSMMVVSCASPSYFTMQNIDYFNQTVSQAQLGNLGISSLDKGMGFQRGAFLSDCGIGTASLSVDSRVPQFEAILTHFGKKANLKSIGSQLGLQPEALERMSVVVVSLDPRQLAELAKLSFNKRCKDYINLNKEYVRIITSVALLIDLPILRQTTVELQIQAELLQNGMIALSVGGIKKPVQAVVSADSVLAYRHAHLCWEEEPGVDFLLRVDDEAYEMCPEGYVDFPPEGWLWESDRVPESTDARYDTPNQVNFQQGNLKNSQNRGKHIPILLHKSFFVGRGWEWRGLIIG